MNKRSVRIVVGVFGLLLLFLALGLFGFGGFQDYGTSLLLGSVAAVLTVEAGLKGFKKITAPQLLSILDAFVLGIVAILKLPFINATGGFIAPIAGIGIVVAAALLFKELAEL